MWLRSLDTYTSFESQINSIQKYIPKFKHLSNLNKLRQNTLLSTNGISISTTTNMFT
jgi:hypothetical protein